MNAVKELSRKLTDLTATVANLATTKELVAANGSCQTLTTEPTDQLSEQPSEAIEAEDPGPLLEPANDNPPPPEATSSTEAASSTSL